MQFEKDTQIVEPVQFKEKKLKKEKEKKKRQKIENEKIEEKTENNDKKETFEFKTQLPNFNEYEK